MVVPQPFEQAIRAILAEWESDLGADRVAYTNHVLRVLSFCDGLSGTAGAVAPSAQPHFQAAAAFHDLGVWTHYTFDYLPPSIELAARWLADHGQDASIPLVCTMIDEHHKIRRAPGHPDAEVFRRADLVDVSAGLRRFGLSRAEYRTIARRFPDAGFRRRLAQLGAQRIRSHPLSPFPMLKW